MEENVITYGQYRKSEIQELKIPETITKIDDFAFEASSLRKIEIPDSVQELGMLSFSNCENLKYVKIGKNVKKIGICAFKNCTELEEVIFDDDCELEEISEECFVDCENLKNVVLPKSLKIIGKKAFCSSKIQKINFEENLIRIEDEAFENCKSLTDFIFPKSLEYIGKSAFYNTNIEKVEITRNIDVKNQAFMRCQNLKSVIWNTDCINSYSNSGCFFYECENLFSVKIGENCEKISHSMFNGCSRLEEIELPQSIKTISDEAFLGCKRLEKIDLPEKLEYIGKSAFSCCYLLEEIKLPKTLKYINELTFKNCVSLCRVVFEEESSVSKILFGAFKNCMNLRFLNIPDSISFIEKDAFFNVNVSFELPKNLKSFRGMSFLKDNRKIELPESVTTIEDCAFQGSQKLKSLKLGDIKNIDESAFYECDFVQDIELGSKSAYEFKEKCLYEKKTKTLIHAFTEVDKTFSIPSFIEHIGKYAFSNFLKSVELPSSLKDSHIFYKGISPELEDFFNKWNVLQKSKEEKIKEIIKSGNRGFLIGSVEEILENLKLEYKTEIIEKAPKGLKVEVSLPFGKIMTRLPEALSDELKSSLKEIFTKSANSEINLEETVQSLKKLKLFTKTVSD